MFQANHKILIYIYNTTSKNTCDTLASSTKSRGAATVSVPKTVLPPQEPLSMDWV